MQDINGFTALILAAKSDRAVLVNKLALADAKLNEKDNDGYSALIWAAKEDYSDIIKELIDNGANRAL